MSNILDVEKNLSFLDPEKAQDINNLENSAASPKLKIQQEKIKAVQADWIEKLNKGYRSQLLIRPAGPKGLGVFADRNYKKGEILEYCHCAVSKWKQAYIFEPSYKQYAYWDNCKCKDCQMHGNKGLLLLGTGSIVNSAETQEASNVDVEVYVGLALSVIRARKNIKTNEELLAWHGEAYFNSWCKPRIEQYAKFKNKKNTESQDVLKEESPAHVKFQAIAGES